MVCGTPVIRPHGQRKPADSRRTGLRARAQRLDIEAEVGFVVGAPARDREGWPPTTSPSTCSVSSLLNDWSARDIQAWEYVPLGPFLGKSFATSISGWVTPLDALAAARVDLPGQDPEPLDYLRVDGQAGLDIDIEVLLNGEVVSRPPYSSMYWSPAQMLAHLTVNGASLRTGDLFAPARSAAPSPTSAARSSSCRGAAPSRSPPAAASAPSSRTATRSRCAPPPRRPRRPDRARRGDRPDRARRRPGAVARGRTRHGRTPVVFYIGCLCKLVAWRTTHRLSNELVVLAARLVRDVRRRNVDLPAASTRLMSLLDELGPITVGPLAEPTAAASRR